MNAPRSRSFRFPLRALCAVLFGLGLGLGLVTTAAAAPSDPSVADVFVVHPDGTTTLYEVGGAEWTQRATTGILPSSALIRGEQNQLLGTVGGVDLSADLVVVNEGPNGLAPGGPAPLAAPFSIVSLVPAEVDPSAPTIPGLDITANTATRPVLPDEVVSSTLRIRLRGIPAPAPLSRAGVGVRWRLNGGPVQTGGREVDLVLASPGEWNVEAWAVQSTARSATKRVRYALSGVSPQLDSDNNGVPDVAEVELGLDPFASEDVAQFDGDGDDVPDLIERLCGPKLGSDPDDPRSVPLDSDGDGWSDCEEGWRGTDPADVQNLHPDAPVAARPFSVEKRLALQAWADRARTTPRTGFGQLVAASLLGTEVPLRLDDLPDDASLLRAGLDLADVPARLRRDQVARRLGEGAVPELRLPAHRPLALRVAGLPGADLDETVVARAWIDGADDWTPARATPAMIADGANWTTGSEWLEAYAALLRERLVVDETVALAPDSGLPLTLFERMLQIARGTTDRPAAFAGAAPPPAGDEEPNTRNLALDSTNAGLAALRVALQRMSFGGDGQPTAGLFGNLVDALWNGPLAANDGPTDDDAERLRAQVAADPLASWLPGVLLFHDRSVLDALSAAARVLLFDPAADFDADFRSNRGEILPRDGRITDPLASDTDGDAFLDGIDACANDPANACADNDYAEMDSDGDGVPDALDNCLDEPNSDQADRDGDGFGDACPRVAHIATPASHLRIFAGESVFFSSVDGFSGGGRKVSHTWNFENAWPVSFDPSPGAVPFDRPGRYVVTLIASDGLRAQSTDRRVIEVQGLAPPPSVSAGGPYQGVEGEPLQLTAVASSPSGAITALDWRLGDGESAQGNPVQHVYAQGAYEVEVSATDVQNRVARDRTHVQVVDSAPSAAFDTSATTGRVPLDVRFDDRSSAFDGIAERSWDFGDGAGATGPASATHRYDRRGVYRTRLDVVDGDGSADHAERELRFGSGLNLLEDKDGDGIADAHERAHGLVVGDDDADGDADRDLRSNADEYRAGVRLDDPGQTPPGPAAGPAYVALRDGFDDRRFDDRWSLGLESPLAVDTAEEVAGVLEFELRAPAGESCAHAALVGFPSADAEAAVARARLRVPAAGELCAGLFSGEADGDRVQVCFDASAAAPRAELHALADGVPTNVVGSLPVEPGAWVELRLEKRGSDWRAFVDAAPLGALTAPLADDRELRFLIGARLCDAVPDLRTAVEEIELLHDRDADGLADLEEDRDADGQTGPGETDAGVADSDGDGYADGYDNCALVANGAGADDQSDRDGDGFGDACECGDASGDGRLNGIDARLIQRCAIGQFLCPELCDVTGDGICNSIDARLIQRYSVGQLAKTDLRCAERP